MLIPAVRTLGEGLFRVEWLGQVLRGTVTSVSVVFAPWQIDPDTGEMGPAAGDHRTVAVPFACLRMFRMGDLWQSGMATGHRDLQARQTFSLSIQEGTAQVMPAGVPLEGTSGRPIYPLPFSVFAGHRENTQSHCVRVAVGSNAWLVIPCLELIRFYFGGSGSFLKRLFSGAFALDKLYKRCQFNSWTGTARVELADDLSGAAAATVARIALDTQAKWAASWIVNSGVAATANRMRYHPKTTFPFLGDTDLTVDGRWIEQYGYRVFLGEQIIRCTHPFPFGSLYYTTSRSHIGTKVQSGAVPHTSQWDGGLVPSAATVIEDVTSDCQLEPANVPLDSAVNPFPDLATKKIRRIKQDGRAHGQSVSSYPLASGDSATLGEAREAEATDGFDELSEEETVSVLNSAFSALESENSGLQIEWTTPNDYSKGDVSGRFVRADRLCSAKEPRLANVWCSMLGYREFEPRLLVMTRDNVAEDVLDHVVFLRFDSRNHSTLSNAILAFAQCDRESFAAIEMETIWTRAATKLTHVLRITSVAMQRMLMRRR